MVVTAAILLWASAMHVSLGRPTFIAGTITTLAVLAVIRQNPINVLRDVSWGVIPLVGGLFVVVEAVNHTGVATILADHLRTLGAQGPVSPCFLISSTICLPVFSPEALSRPRRSPIASLARC